MEENSTSNECYICVSEMDSELLTDVCDCKNRYIHAECQKRLMLECNNGDKCSVCLSKYNNACLVHTEKILYGRLFVHCIVGTIIALSVFLGMLLLSGIYTSMGQRQILIDSNKFENVTELHEWCTDLCRSTNCTSSYVLSEYYGDHCILMPTHVTLIPRDMILLVFSFVGFLVNAKLYRKYIVNTPLKERVTRVKFYSESETASETQSS